MKRTESLRTLLEDQTAVLNGGERLDVDFDTTSYANFDGSVVVAPNVREFIGRNLSGPDELRVIRDTLSHEVEHVRESNLTGKRDFAEEYGRYGGLAGYVWNVAEDAYIDRNRLRRFRGLRKTRAFVVDAVMDNHQRRPRIDTLDRAEAMAEGLLQVSVSGGAKGIKNAEPTVQEYLAWARHKIDEARTTPNQDARVAIYYELADELIRRLPKLSDDELDDLERMINEMPTDDVEAGSKTGPSRVEPEAESDDGEQPQASAGDVDDATDDDADPDADDADTGDDVDGSSVSDDPDVEADGSDSGTASGASRATPDDLSDELDDMESNASKSGAWYDAGDDYETADDSDVHRYEELQKLVQKERNDVGKQKKERDRRMNADSRKYGWYRSSRVRSKVEDSGLAKEIEAAFRELKTRDHEFTAEQGDDLNIDGYIRHEAGDFMETEFYYDIERAAIGDRAVGVALDMSLSMDEMEAKKAVAALAIATETIGDKFTASAFYTGGARDYVQTKLITAPDEEFQYEHLDAVESNGNTPTTSGVLHTKSLLDEASAREKVLLVVTDGAANTRHDGGLNGGEEARAEVLQAVQNARMDGVKVIGLGVGGGIDTTKMTDQFGPNGFVMVDSKNLTAALIEVYRAQLGIGDEY